MGIGWYRRYIKLSAVSECSENNQIIPIKLANIFNNALPLNKINGNNRRRQQSTRQTRHHPLHLHPRPQPTLGPHQPHILTQDPNIFPLLLPPLQSPNNISYNIRDVK